MVRRGNLAEMEFHFTFSKLEKQLISAKEYGYQFITCQDYVKAKSAKKIPCPVVVSRVDIDFSCRKSRRLAEIFNRIGGKATFFVRLHAPEYNPFDFENYRCLKYIRDSGNEIGYHSEIVDQAAIWQEDPADCLRRDISVLNHMLGIQIKGVASHRGMTGLNNLDFWSDKKPAEFDLLYEAYDKEPTFNLFDTSFYISDSEWIRWKCYRNGELVGADHRNFGQHIADKHQLIYLLIHPDTYFDEHFYE